MIQSRDNKGRVDVIIPAYKPEDSFQKLIKRLMKQTITPNHIYILQTVEQEGERLIQPEDDRISVHPVLKQDFDHGATRHYGATLAQGDYLLYMTQDAMPADHEVIERLLSAFEDERTAVAYGRQLAGEGADILEQLARKHNYPEQSRVKTADDLERLGIKTYFCSDVCAMYRRDVYEEMGGFVHPTIFNEDMIMAASVIHAGYQVSYCAGAKVIHSHSYTCMQQFHRNFDLGVSQRQYHEVFDSVSSEKEGAGFAKQSLLYLLRRGRLWTAFYFALQCGFKLFGYQLGKRYDRLPKKMVLFCTTNPSYAAFKRRKESLSRQ